LSLPNGVTAADANAEASGERVGEPDADPVQIDTLPTAVDERRREGFLVADQPQLRVAVAEGVRAEVADVLRGRRTESRPAAAGKNVNS
jgi:hypothetical protein